MSDDKRKIHCEAHGDQQEIFVRQHVVQSLHTRESVGFWWAADPGNNRPDAWCTACAQLLIPVGEGRPEYRYKLSNKGGKPINYFTVVAWSAEGTGGTLGGQLPWDGRVTDRLLQAGESVKVGRDDVVVVPWNPSVREKLHLGGKLQTLVVLLVDQITFADGTKYDFQAASKSLIEYFSDRAK